METSELIIRQYTPEDQSDVFELHAKAMKAASAFKSGPWDEDFKNIKAVYIERGGDFLVGHIQGKLAVMGALKNTGGVAELKRLRVDPDFQRRGLGQLMLEKIEARAKELGFKKMVLDVLPIQKPAIALYEKNGYTKVKEGDIFGFTCIYYEKML